MSAMPEHIAAGHPHKGYKAYWAAILKTAAANGGAFTIREIDGACNTHKRTIRQYVNALVLAGYAEHNGYADYQAKVYFLKLRPTEAPRLKHDGTHVIMGRGREQIWRAMQMHKNFTKKDLVVFASTDEQTVTETAVKEYLTFLHRAGYLALVSKSKPGTPARYRLKPDMNSGPKPPLIQRVKAVFDQNWQKVVWGEKHA